MVIGLNHYGNIAKKECILSQCLLQFNKQKALTQKEVNFVSMFDGVQETD
jgi:hypothetical protein